MRSKVQNLMEFDLQQLNLSLKSSKIYLWLTQAEQDMPKPRKVYKKVVPQDIDNFFTPIFKASTVVNSSKSDIEHFSRNAR